MMMKKLLVLLLLLFSLIPLVSAGWVVFESANTTFFNASWTDPDKVIDNDFSTFGQAQNLDQKFRYFFNYSVVAGNVTNITLEYKSSTTKNFSLPPDCFNESIVQFLALPLKFGVSPDRTFWFCWNYSSGEFSQWEADVSSGGVVYEERLFMFVVEEPEIAEVCIGDLASPAVNFFVFVAIVFLLFGSLAKRFEKHFRILLVIGLIVVFAGLSLWLLGRMLTGGIC